MKIIRGSEMQFVPAAHEDPRSPGVLRRVLASRDQLMPGRVQMVNWARMPARAAFRRHYHEDMEELFIMLDGASEFEVDGTEIQLAMGDAILIAPNERHLMRNPSDKDLHYMVVGIAGDKNGKTVLA